MIVRLFAPLLFLSLSTPALAHWQSTQWGMTTQTLLALPQITRLNATEAKKQALAPPWGAPVAKSTYRTKDFEFTAYYFAKGDKLEAVRILARDPSDGYRIQQQLLSAYGKSIESSDKWIAGCHLTSARWNDLKAKNAVMFSHFVCTSSNIESSAAVLYEPLKTKEDSGL